MTDEATEKALRHRASLFSSLPAIEAFQALQDESERKKMRMTEALIARVMSGDSLEILQRQVDYDRGFIEGMNYLARLIPAGATRMLASRNEQTLADVEDNDVDLWAYGEENREQPE